MKTLKWLILIVLIIGAGAAYYAYTEYNRSHKDLNEKKPDFSMNALEFIEAFESNEEQASAKYSDKIIEISGKIEEVEEDDEYDTVYMGNPETLSMIICEMENSVRLAELGLKVGDEVLIRGVCAGYQSDDLGIGSFILLQRCIIPQK